MSDKSFRTAVVGLLSIQLLVFFMIFNKLDSGWLTVYDQSDKSNCGDSARDPCYVKALR